MGKWVPHRTVANEDWSIWQEDNGRYSHHSVDRAILLDIRAELQRLNSVLQCPNFIAVPSKLDKIERNTRKRRKPRVVGKPKLRVVRS